jgi:hypothetical protein
VAKASAKLRKAARHILVLGYCSTRLALRVRPDLGYALRLQTGKREARFSNLKSSFLGSRDIATLQSGILQGVVSVSWLQGVCKAHRFHMNRTL